MILGVLVTPQNSYFLNGKEIAICEPLNFVDISVSAIANFLDDLVLDSFQLNHSI